MYFSDLKAAVETSSGPRTDIPDHIYTLARSELNRDIRITEMQRWDDLAINPDTTLAALVSLIEIDGDALPADLLEIEEINTQVNGIRRVFTPVLRAAQTEAANEYKRTYSITNDGIVLTGAPAEEFTLNILYYRRLDVLAADTDTNAVLLNYPDLYLSLCLHFVARWAENSDAAAMHRADYEAAKRALRKSDRMSRHPGPIRPRSQRVA